MILEATVNVQSANLVQDLTGVPFRWFRILSAPLGAVVKLTTIQPGKTSGPFTIVQGADWLDLVEPCTISRIQSSVAGPILFQYSLDDKIWNNVGSPSSGGGGGGAFSPTTFSIADNTTSSYTPPVGTATLRIQVSSVLGGSILRLESPDSRFILVQTQEGSGYMTINKAGVYYADVAGYNPSEGPLQLVNFGGGSGGTITVTIMPAAVERLNPMRSITLYDLDLSITPGTTGVNGTTAGPYFFPLAKSIDAFFTLSSATVPDGTDINLSIYPTMPDGTIITGSNVQATLDTGPSSGWAGSTPTFGMHLEGPWGQSYSFANGQYGWPGPNQLNAVWPPAPGIDLQFVEGSGSGVKFGQCSLTFNF